MARDPVSHHGEENRRHQQDAPEPEAIAPKHCFLLRDVNSNLNGVCAFRRLADRGGGTADPEGLSMPSHDRGRAFGSAADSTGKFRKIQLIAHAGRSEDWHAAFIEQANVELLISTCRRFQFDLFAQPILVVGAISQHRSQDL